MDSGGQWPMVDNEQCWSMDNGGQWTIVQPENWIKIKTSLSKSRFRGMSRGRGWRAVVASGAGAQCRGIRAIPVEDQALKPVQPHP